MVPRHVVERLAATLRDESELLAHLDLDENDYYSIASRTLEVATAELSLDWPADEKPPELVGVDPDHAGEPPSDGRSP